MNLKEAFRWQNHLDQLLRTAYAVVNTEKHVIRESRVHHYSNIIATLEDKTEEVYEPYENHSAEDLIHCIMYLQTMKEALTKAIFDVKSTITVDVDLANNVCRRNTLERIKWLLSIKDKEQIISGIGKTFNAEGNQVSYQYDISVKKTPDFDQGKLKKVYRDLYEEVETTSAHIDDEMINTNVEFKPQFSLSDSLSDVINFVCR